MSLPSRELPANRFCGAGLVSLHARAQRRAESGRTRRSAGCLALGMTERQVWRGWYVALPEHDELQQALCQTDEDFVTNCFSYGFKEMLLENFHNARVFRSISIQPGPGMDIF